MKAVLMTLPEGSPCAHPKFQQPEGGQAEMALSNEPMSLQTPPRYWIHNPRPRRRSPYADALQTYFFQQSLLDGLNLFFRRLEDSLQTLFFLRSSSFL
jgi:hypothetical protein